MDSTTPNPGRTPVPKAIIITLVLLSGTIFGLVIGIFACLAGHQPLYDATMTALGSTVPVTTLAVMLVIWTRP